MKEPQFNVGDIVYSAHLEDFADASIYIVERARHRYVQFKGKQTYSHSEYRFLRIFGTSTRKLVTDSYHLLSPTLSRDCIFSRHPMPRAMHGIHELRNNKTFPYFIKYCTIIRQEYANPRRRSPYLKLTDIDKAYFRIHANIIAYAENIDSPMTISHKDLRPFKDLFYAYARKILYADMEHTNLSMPSLPSL